MASGKSIRMGAASHASPPQQDSVVPTGDMLVEWPQIISNGQSYALRTNESLMVGFLNGGAPTMFETMSISEGILNLVGMAMM